jgi:hypothetical protein
MTKHGLWERVERGAGCWEWPGSRNAHGYGQVKVGSIRRAHRLAWTLAFGPIPAGMNVCHTCDNPPCCNPTHRVRWAAGERGRAMANDFGITPQNVWLVATGRTWKED